MRRDEAYFEGRELVLVHISKRLSDALALEKLLTEREIDYLVEVDTYTGGLVFRTTRAGAFFYVEEACRDTARQLLRQQGFQVFEED